MRHVQDIRSASTMYVLECPHGCTEERWDGRMCIYQYHFGKGFIRIVVLSYDKNTNFQREKHCQKTTSQKNTASSSLISLFSGNSTPTPGTVMVEVPTTLTALFTTTSIKMYYTSEQNVKHTSFPFLSTQNIPTLTETIVLSLQGVGIKRGNLSQDAQVVRNPMSLNSPTVDMFSYWRPVW